MLAFATPSALIGLAALALPIALHLWSRRTGPATRIGSIAFFAAAPPPITRRPRLEDLWLLLLRCGIITALALALANPYWRSERPGHAGTWALVDSAVAADAASRTLLDSLRSAGADVRTLATGPIWSLLREADYEAPSGTKLVVVAANSGARGERPTLRSEVQWIVPPLRIAERGSGGEDKGARETVRSVFIYSDPSRRDDARYVTAALRAAAEATGPPGVFTQRDAAVISGAHTEWLVWLAARPVPAALLERVRAGAWLLSDAVDDEPRELSGRLRLTAADANGPAPLVRRRTDVAPGSAPVWTDDAGRPLLTLQREGAGLWLRFHARFHPSWGDFVLHPAFPQAIAALWAGDSHGPQPVALSQLVPARDTTAGRAPSPARRDLYHVFWLAGVLLFLLERRVAR